MHNYAESTLRPVRLPVVRDRLARHWNEQRLSRRSLTAEQNNLTNFQVFVPGEVIGRPDELAVQQRGPMTAELAEQVCRRLGDGLADADLYWISPQFTRLAAEAARELPDTSITAEELPSPSGLLVFAEPVLDSLWEADTTTGPRTGTTKTDAIGWFTVPHGVWVTTYVVPERQMPDVPVAVLREEIGFLLPHSPGGGLRFGALSDIPARSPILAVLLSTWLLIAQPGVADDQSGPVDKGLKKRNERRGLRHPDVHVINLRRRPVPQGREPAEAGRTYNVRWIVKGHWRDQAWGPGRSLRRRTFIAPYLKGPDDAPIKDTTDTVKKLS